LINLGSVFLASATLTFMTAHYSYNM
jgi:hypothetical protein